MDFYLLCEFLLLGAITGLFAGLFGIGGGGIMVPILSLVFTRLAWPTEHIMHLALGTSMAAIVPTALASLRAHHQRQAVLWKLVGQLTPGVLLGTFAGSFLASHLSSKPLALIFSGFMALVAVQMFMERKPKPAKPLPNGWVMAAVGGGIGSISALVAIGGGTLTVPFLVWRNIALPVAIGTSAAVGLPIALAGAVGYASNGWGAANLPDHSLGFIYWPAVLAMACASLFTAPLGARLAHRLPRAVLKKWFALLLACLSFQMLYRVLGN